MGRRKKEKLPSIEEFTEVLKNTGGNTTNAAKMLGVNRITIMRWANKHPEIDDVIKNARKQLFDKCLSTAQIVALGIPKINEKTGLVEGWEEKPDSSMLRYFLSTLGKDEGFREGVDVTTDNKPLQQEILSVNVDSLSDEERRLLLKLSRSRNGNK